MLLTPLTQHSLKNKIWSIGEPIEIADDAAADDDVDAVIQINIHKRKY